MNTEVKNTANSGLQSCGLKEFIDAAKAKKALSIKEKTVIKK